MTVHLKTYPKAVLSDNLDKQGAASGQKLPPRGSSLSPDSKMSLLAGPSLLGEVGDNETFGAIGCFVTELGSEETSISEAKEASGVEAVMVTVGTETVEEVAASCAEFVTNFFNFCVSRLLIATSSAAANLRMSSSVVSIVFLE